MSTKSARVLRRTSTWAERKLWQRLRNRAFAQVKFRRQHPIGPYTLDFYCVAKKLAVELDGDVHGISGRKNHDTVRDAYLEKRGIRVLRFWNVEVRDNLDDVLDMIYAALCGPEKPSP